MQLDMCRRYSLDEFIAVFQFMHDMMFSLIDSVSCILKRALMSGRTCSCSSDLSTSARSLPRVSAKYILPYGRMHIMYPWLYGSSCT
eukprot:16126542-Heterocapsa_arctica.AAC.1